MIWEGLWNWLTLSNGATLPKFALDGLTKNGNISFKIAAVPAEIQIGHLPHTSLECGVTNGPAGMATAYSECRPKLEPSANVETVLICWRRQGVAPLLPKYRRHVRQEGTYMGSPSRVLVETQVIVLPSFLHLNFVILIHFMFSSVFSSLPLLSSPHPATPLLSFFF